MTAHTPSAESPISRNVEKVARSLFPSEIDRREFLEAVSRGDSGVTAMVWLRSEPDAGAVQEGTRQEWLPSWISVAAEGERPGKLAAHAAGEFY